MGGWGLALAGGEESDALLAGDEGLFAAGAADKGGGVFGAVVPVTDFSGGVFSVVLA